MSLEFARVHVLQFAPMALARCFVVADVLRERLGEARLEYGLLGLTRASDSFRVVATPLLPGQEASISHVETSGYNLMRLRSETAALARELNEPLYPLCFVHRHPGARVDPSKTDLEFAASVFVNQVAASHTFVETIRLRSDFHQRDFLKRREDGCPLAASTQKPRSVSVECALGFSLVVSAVPAHFVFAVRREWCPECGVPRTFFAPAELRRFPDRALSTLEWKRMRADLEAEAVKKVHVVDPPEKRSCKA